MPPTAFIAAILAGAQECQRLHGIPTSITIAQAALETGWGKVVVGNNLFGIKADKSWKGPTVTFQTTEEIKGKRVGMPDVFRAYDSWADAVMDRGLFLKQNKRYAGCFKLKTGPEWADALQAAGYATDSNYAKSLKAVMRGRDMAQYDILPEVK